MSEYTSKCDDCSRPYGEEHGFPDMLVSCEVWAQIYPEEAADFGGLLCPCCILARMYRAGLYKEPVAFAARAADGVPLTQMRLLREVENITLGIMGRDNKIGCALRGKPWGRPAPTPGGRDEG